MHLYCGQLGPIECGCSFYEKNVVTDRDWPQERKCDRSQWKYGLILIKWLLVCEQIYFELCNDDFFLYMPDMLSVEEETALLTDSIRMDHCYTNLSPSSAPATSSTPNHQYGSVASSDTDASDNSFEQELGRQPVVTSSTPTQHSARARGRVSFQDCS